MPPMSSSLAALLEILRWQPLVPDHLASDCICLASDPGSIVSFLCHLLDSDHVHSSDDLSVRKTASPIVCKTDWVEAAACGCLAGLNLFGLLVWLPGSISQKHLFSSSF